MAKKVLFAHTKEIIQFDSEEEIKEYLDKQIFQYKLLNKKKVNGKFVITFIKAYNKAPMLDEPCVEACNPSEDYSFETGV